MPFDLITTVYIAGGLVLPIFYLPQIRRCHLDNSGLASFSMTKTAVMTTLRVAMLPFVLRVGNDIMSFIVALDTAGRLLELLAAVRSLYRQGWTTREILLRMLPSMERSSRASERVMSDAAPAAAASPRPVDAAMSPPPAPPVRLASGFMPLEPLAAAPTETATSDAHAEATLATAR